MIFGLDIGKNISFVVYFSPRIFLSRHFSVLFYNMAVGRFFVLAHVIY